MKRWTSNVAIILSWCVSIGCWFDTTKRYLPSTAYHRLGVRHWIELFSYYYSMLCYGLRIQHYVEPPPLQRMIGWALEIRYSQFPSTVYDGLRFEYQVELSTYQCIIGWVSDVKVEISACHSVAWYWALYNQTELCIQSVTNSRSVLLWVRLGVWHYIGLST